MKGKHILKKVAAVVLGGLMLSSSMPTYASDLLIPESGLDLKFEKVVPLDKEHFPDDAFRKEMEYYDGTDRVDREKDGWLSNYEILGIKDFICSNTDIKSVQGIEYLTELGLVVLSETSIESLDLSHNIKLKSVEVARCQSLTELNVSTLTQLEQLIIDETKIRSIDLSQNTLLEHFQCSNTLLENLDLSHNKNLKRFYCEYNNVKPIDFSQNTKLTNVVVQESRFPYLNFRNQPDLNILYTSWQHIDVNAWMIDGKWQVPLSQLIPMEYLQYVSVVDDWLSYNPSTGMVVLPDEKQETFDYAYLITDKDMPEYDVPDPEFMWVQATVSYKEGEMPGPLPQPQPDPKPDETILVENIFEDVNAGDWYRDSAQYVYDNKIMTGLNKTQFGPSENLARAQLALILYRMEGEPNVTFESKFGDVREGEWYANAVIWAYQNGIITGYSDSGLFKPANNISRQEMATMMYRYANYKGYDVSNRADLSKFPDNSNVSKYAKEPLQWCVATGIISGDGQTGELMPLGTTNRAVCATIITRFIQKN